MLDFFIKFATIGIVGFVFWRMLRPRYPLEIVIGEHGINRHTGLPKAHEASVLEFLDKFQSSNVTVRIYGMRQSDGYLRLVFNGKIDPGTRQQIRNFLITVL